METPLNERLLVAIDIETSGPSVMRNDMVSFAAVAVRYPSGIEVASYEAYILPITGEIRYNERTLNEFWLKNPLAWESMLNGIKNKGVPASKAMQGFVDWIRGLHVIPLIIFDTVGFDAGFINRYLEFSNAESIDYITGEYIPCFDTSSYHRGIAQRDWAASIWNNDEYAARWLGLPCLEGECPYNNSHYPLEDARKIAWITCKIAARFASLC